MPTYTSLKGITNIANATLDTHIQVGLKYFFDWGLLGAGAFFNVRIPTSGQYGGQQHILRSVNDPSYRNGQVFEGFRKDWVWESGIDFAGQPIGISGVNVNGTFYPSNTAGAYSHYVDYPLGRIIFNNPISANSTVKAEFSYRWAQIAFDDQPWFVEPEFLSFRNDNSNFAAGSGQWSELAQDRLEMPAIVIQIGKRRPSRGMMIGGGQIISQDVLFNILTENPGDSRKLRDIILDQDEKSFYLFNLNSLATDNRFPLTPLGALNTNRPPSYPELVQETAASGYRYKFCTFKRTTAGAIQKLYSNFYWTTVQSTIEVERPNIT